MSTGPRTTVTAASATSPPTGAKSVIALPPPSNNNPLLLDEDSLRNVYIRNLDPRVSAEELRQIFEPFGEVEAHKLMVDIKTGVSRGFGFVMYRRSTDAAAAVRGLDGFEVYNSKLQVRLADTKTRPPGEPTRRLFLRNLPPSYTQADVEALCGGYGVVVSCVVRRDERHAQVCSDGGLTLVAHVEMATVEAAQNVVRSLNNSTMFCPHVPSALLSKVVDHGKQASPSPASFDLSKLQLGAQANLSSSGNTPSTPQHPSRAKAVAQPLPSFATPANAPPVQMTRVTVGSHRGGGGGPMQMVSSGREQQLPSPASQFPTAHPPPPLVLPSPQTPSLQPPPQHGIIQFDSSFTGDSFSHPPSSWYAQPLSSPSHQQPHNATPPFMSSSLTTNPMQVHHGTPTANLSQTVQTAYVGPGGQILFFRHEDAQFSASLPPPAAPDMTMQPYPPSPYHATHPHPHHHAPYMMPPTPDLSASYGAYVSHHHHHHQHQHHQHHHH